MIGDRLPDYFGVPWGKLDDYDVKSEGHERLGVGHAIIHLAGKPVLPAAYTEGEIANMVDLSYRTLFERKAMDEQAERATNGYPIIPILRPPIGN